MSGAKIGAVIALIIFWVLFIWQLVMGTSPVTVGLIGLATGVLTGVAFPSRRQILHETK